MFESNWGIVGHPDRKSRSVDCGWKHLRRIWECRSKLNNCVTVVFRSSHPLDQKTPSYLAQLRNSQKPPQKREKKKQAPVCHTENISGKETNWKGGGEEKLAEWNLVAKMLLKKSSNHQSLMSHKLHCIIHFSVAQFLGYLHVYQFFVLCIVKLGLLLIRCIYFYFCPLKIRMQINQSKCEGVLWSL